MDNIFIVETVYHDSSYSRFKKDIKIFGRDLAVEIGKENADCVNVFSVDVVDASTGEVIYSKEESGIVYEAQES